MQTEFSKNLANFISKKLAIFFSKSQKNSRNLSKPSLSCRFQNFSKILILVANFTAAKVDKILTFSQPSSSLCLITEPFFVPSICQNRLCYYVTTKIFPLFLSRLFNDKKIDKFNFGSTIFRLL